MALRLKNRVKETTTTTGTGTITVSGTAPTGFQTFASALSDGDTTYYQITDGTNWEIGLGTWDETAGTIARTTIFESSNSNSAVSWGSGSKDVFIVMPAEKVSGTTSYSATSEMPLTANQIGDQAFVTANNNLYIWNGSGWYKIATVNQTPTISGNNATYALATDGTATTVTLTGTDPEGFPLTWSATESGDVDIAATTNVDNVFTITPVTSGSGGTMSVTFAASDGVNTATASSTFTLLFLSPIWSDLSLSIGTSATNSLTNETFIDRSSNALTVTATNDPIQTALHPYLDNYGVEFDNLQERLVTGSSTDFGIGTNDFSFECWFYVKSATYGWTTYPTGFGLGANYGGADTARLILKDAANADKITFTLVSTRVLIPTSQTFEFGQWNHIVVCRSSSTLSMFYNGTRIATASNSDNINSGNATHLYIGHTGSNTEGFRGIASNARFINGSSAYDATSTSITVPTEKLTAVTNTKLLTAQSNRFIDNSSSAHALTLNLTPLVTANNPFGQDSEYAVGANKGSVYLDTGDEVVITHDASISAGTGDFCLQFWVYADSADNLSYKGLVTKYSGGAGGIWIQPLSGVLQVGLSTSILGTGTKNVMDNQWHHIAWTRSGSACKVFVDGEQEISFTASDNLNNTVDMLIGDMGSINRNFKGYVSDLKYDVGNAVYTSAFTPPTSPVGNTNADLYLPMDNAGIFDKTGNGTLALSGNTATSTTQNKFATTSMYFDGAGDYVEIADNPLFDLVGDFTLEFWMYHTSTTDTGYSAVVGGNGSGSNGWQIYMIESSGNLYFYHSTFLVTATSALTVNTWHHVAVARSGSSLKMFVDGTQVGSTATTSATLVQNSSNLGTRIGYDFNANGYYEGYIENLQLVNNVAKYTANFTAPTQEQGRQYQAED